MCRFMVNQRLTVPNLNSVSMNKILVTEFIIVKPTTLVGTCFHSNRMSGTKKHRVQNKEQRSTKYSN